MKLILPVDAKHSGIDIVYSKKHKSLHIGGWYDSFVGIEPTDMSLAQFFRLLGITEKDCKLAFTQHASDAGEEEK